MNAIEAEPTKILADQWNSYDITADGDHFVVVLNGKKVLDGTDSKHSAGVVGLQYNTRRRQGRVPEHQNQADQALTVGQALSPAKKRGLRAGRAPRSQIDGHYFVQGYGRCGGLDPSPALPPLSLGFAHQEPDTARLGPVG